MKIGFLKLGEQKIEGQQPGKVNIKNGILGMGEHGCRKLAIPRQRCSLRDSGESSYVRLRALSRFIRDAFETLSSSVWCRVVSSDAQYENKRKPTLPPHGEHRTRTKG